jgi:hypothetical protein
MYRLFRVTRSREKEKTTKYSFDTYIYCCKKLGDAKTYGYVGVDI